MKTCETCDVPLVKPKGTSGRQWQARRFCSKPCKERAPKRPLVERFWEKVDKRTGSCWNWIASHDGHGYGTITDKQRSASPLKAHRVSWELHFGPLPAGLVVRHKCDNPACVNPNHLELGTHQDNALDRVKRGRTNPVSLLNLRPGARGFHGAGPISAKECSNVE